MCCLHKDTPIVGFQPFVCCIAAKLYTFIKSTNFCDKNINHTPIIVVFRMHIPSTCAKPTPLSVDANAQTIAH